MRTNDIHNALFPDECRTLRAVIMNTPIRYFSIITYGLYRFFGFGNSVHCSSRDVNEYYVQLYTCLTKNCNYFEHKCGCVRIEYVRNLDQHKC